MRFDCDRIRAVHLSAIRLSKESRRICGFFICDQTSMYLERSQLDPRTLTPLHNLFQPERTDHRFYVGDQSLPHTFHNFTDGDAEGF